MENKLPENWDGTFFKEEEASMIANMTADEFANSLMKNNSEDAKFFLAGAIFDFQWHGLTKKAEELVKVASEMFEGPYERIPKMIADGKRKIEAGLNEEGAKAMFARVVREVFEDQKGVVLDLKICTVGMSCEEYTTLVIGGPFREDLPSSVQKLMEQHKKECSYHQSETFHQSAVNTPVTKETEQAANRIIEKYSE